MHIKFKENRVRKGLQTTAQILGQKSRKKTKKKKFDVADKKGAGIGLPWYTNASRLFEGAASISVP